MSEKKVALITGAAGMIGPEICAELQAAGWKVAATDVSLERFALYENVHRRAFPADLRLAGDLEQHADCLRLIEESRVLGPIGLLVHGATGSKHCRLAEMDPVLCERIMRIDVLAPIYLAQAATADLAQTRGLIVQLSSVLVNRIDPGNFLYTVAKAAVEKMVECLAVEFAPHGARVNGIRIGSVPGDSFLRGAMAMLPPELAARLRDEIVPPHVRDSAGLSLTGRSGAPSDIAGMILHLLSPAGEFINGAILPVDGAFHLLPRGAPVGRTFSNYPGSWQRNPRETLEKWLKEKGIDYPI